MATLNPYLNFSGTTEDAFNLYRSVFGGDFAAVQRFKDVPGTEHLTENEKNKIMHISLAVGDSHIMGTDALESMGHKLSSGNNFYICINAKTKAEADQFFNGLAAGGKIESPMQDTFWGAYFGSLIDKFDTHWMINCDNK